MTLEFEDTALGDHISRSRSRDNFIDRVNAFWLWSEHLELWKKSGKPNPFDDGDVSMVEFMKVQMSI